MLSVVGVLALSTLIIGGAWFLGYRFGRMMMAQDEMHILLARRLAPPAELQHMATKGLTPAIEAMVREAFRIAHRDDASAPTIDHLRAVLLMHEDAIRHFDRLGAQLLAAASARKSAERSRDLLIRWIRQSVHLAESQEDLLDAVREHDRAMAKRPPMIAFVDTDAHGHLKLGRPN